MLNFPQNHAKIHAYFPPKYCAIFTLKIYEKKTIILAFYSYIFDIFGIVVLHFDLEEKVRHKLSDKENDGRYWDHVTKIPHWGI